MIITFVARAEEPDRQEQLVNRLSALQRDIERLTDTSQLLHSRRQKLSQELDRLSANIERKKQNLPLEGLLPSPALDADLRRAKMVSDELEELSRAIGELEAARSRMGEELLAAMERLLEEKMEKISSLSGEARQREIAALEQLSREYERLLQDGSRQSTTFEGHMPLFEDSDDEENLRHLADVLSDAQDKLRRRLAELDESIKHTRSQMRLERRLNQFITDQELFGENRALLRSTIITAPKRGADETPGNLAGGADGYGARAPDSLSGPELGQNYPEINHAAGHPQDRLKLLETQRRQLVEELKKLQKQYDRLQEKLESLR